MPTVRKTLSPRWFPTGALVLCLLGFSAACAGSARKPERRTEWLPDAKGKPIQLRTSPELDEIARLEDARSTGDGRVIELVSDDDPVVRRRAAVALGRLPFPELGSEVTDALCASLEDSDAEVRRIAAFGLGLRGDPRAVGVLVAYLNDPDPLLRARIVEAASRVATSDVQAELILALRDSDLQVRIEAAVATARWDPGAPNAEQVDRALLDALRPYSISPGRTTRTAVEAELVWHILYALSRRGTSIGRGAFLEYADSDAALERIFALQGLARIEGDQETVAAAARVLVGDKRSPDWRVAYEAAVALGKIAMPRGLAALEAAVENESVHVRAGVMQALGSYRGNDKAIRLLNRGMVDLSPSVRNAALASLVRVLPPDDAFKRLASSAKEDEVPLRLGAADAAASLDDPRVVGVLRSLAADPNLLVATHAVESLGHHVDPEVRELLQELLASDDNGIRLAAVLALRNAPDALDTPHLVRAFETSRGDVAAEVAFNVLENLGKIGGDAARELLLKAVEDPRPHVRSVAVRVLEQSFGLKVEYSPPPKLETAPVPLPGKDYPLWRFDPLVEINTSRGAMVFELFPAEAPVHVVNFIELAKRGAYDGLIFHRVVPDFVIQGGDYRGDGNGAMPWRGGSLRNEFGPRKFVRGSLGMPRNEDVDSGGSQFFVTHRPTPHLDGRYTIFGELRAGGDVLDRIEVSDRILSVRVLP